jgi:hypothetical protein
MGLKITYTNNSGKEINVRDTAIVCYHYCNNIPKIKEELDIFYNLFKKVAAFYTKAQNIMLGRKKKAPAPDYKDIFILRFGTRDKLQEVFGCTKEELDQALCCQVEEGLQIAADADNRGEKRLQSVVHTANEGEKGLQSVAYTANRGEHKLQSVAHTANGGEKELQSVAHTDNKGEKELQSVAHTDNKGEKGLQIARSKSIISQGKGERQGGSRPQNKKILLPWIWKQVFNISPKTFLLLAYYISIKEWILIVRKRQDGLFIDICKAVLYSVNIGGEKPYKSFRQDA